QLLEAAGCGAVLALDRLPRPAGVPLERWLMTFPSFGFVLAAAPERAAEACAAFTRRGLACAVCGRFDDSRALRISAGGDASAEVWDLAADPLTGMGA
ncbi:MAG: AIR synthase-related protein, partial [Gaiellaceae bacterium]